MDKKCSVCSLCIIFFIQALGKLHKDERGRGHRDRAPGQQRRTRAAGLELLPPSPAETPARSDFCLSYLGFAFLLKVYVSFAKQMLLQLTDLRAAAFKWAPAEPPVLALGGWELRGAPRAVLSTAPVNLGLYGWAIWRGLIFCLYNHSHFMNKMCICREVTLITNFLGTLEKKCSVRVSSTGGPDLSWCLRPAPLWFPHRKLHSEVFMGAQKAFP